MKYQKLNIKNKLFILTLALVLLGVVGYGTAKAYAGEPGGYPPIVQKLVERFGLNEDEVKAVFDEERTEHQAQMQARFEERLSQFVSDGKITEEQKQAILAKKEEMQGNREEFKDLSAEERKQKMEERRQEMQSWAEQNGIDVDLLPMVMGGGPGHRGGFGGRGFGGSAPEQEETN